MMPVSLGNNRTSLTLEQFRHSHLGIIVVVSVGNNGTNSHLPVAFAVNKKKCMKN